MRALPNEVVVVYDNLQPEQPGEFMEPLVKDTVASAVHGAIGHVDASPVVVRAKLAYRRPTNEELARQFLAGFVRPSVCTHPTNQSTTRPHTHARAPSVFGGGSVVLLLLLLLLLLFLLLCFCVCGGGVVVVVVVADVVAVVIVVVAVFGTLCRC